MHAAQSIAGTFISAVACLATAAPPIKPRPIMLAINFTLYSSIGFKFVFEMLDPPQFFLNQDLKEVERIAIL